MKNKKIVIAGGTGFIGESLVQYFSGNNEVIVLTRGKKNVQTNLFQKNRHINAAGSVKYVLWDACQQGDWADSIEGAAIIINLCGKTVNCRYTEQNKKEIFDSRTHSTAALGEAIRDAKDPPRLWINSSSATIYRHATDRPQDEFTGEIENDFSVQVCKRWEKTFFDIRTPFTRKVALRMAVTLGSGGVIIPYFNLLKFGLGGYQGNGLQMYSWIHIADTCRIVEWVAAHEEMEGVYNCCSPAPVTNAVFMKTLQKATGHQFGLPAYTWMLKAGARLIGTETELLLKSRWVIPTRLMQSGFNFQFVQIEDAFKEIVSVTERKQYHLF